MSDVELHELSPGEAPISRRYSKLYRCDFSEITGEDADAADRFDDASLMPFLARVGGRLA